MRLTAEQAQLIASAKMCSDVTQEEWNRMYVPTHTKPTKGQILKATETAAKIVSRNVR